MSKVKSKDTSIELILRKELWHRGLRYRKNFQKIIGKPDIVFLKKKIAVFCDSEFWHGKQYLEGKMPKSNKEYWEEKFKRNIKRDQIVNQTLESMNWIVIRFWDKKIKKDVKSCADIIETAVLSRR